MPVIAAVMDHATMPFAKSVAAIPTAQVHMPMTMGHLRPMASEKIALESSF